MQRLSSLVKSIFDFVVALLGLIILSPLFILIAILIKRDSPGPIFFWGTRVGKDGRLFKILKFRTMYEEPESYQGPCITSKDDRRITSFGHWLRDTKINELPQLWNVLIGNMSLVGPRPEAPEIAKDWPEEVRRQIFSIRPGITSPASILYHDEEGKLSAKDVIGEYISNMLPDKMRLDRLYVFNHSFTSDLDIIFWTIVVLIPKLIKGKIPAGHFFAGPISRFVRRYVSWFFVDLTISLGSISMIVVIWRSQVPLHWGVDHLIVLAFLFALFFSSANSLMGFNRILWSQAPAEEANLLVISGLLVSVTLFVANQLQLNKTWLPYPALPPAMIMVIGLSTTLCLIIARYRLRILTGFARRWLNWRNKVPSVGERVIIIGAGEEGKIAYDLFKQGIFRRAFSVIGMVDDYELRNKGMLIDGCLVLGGIDELKWLIEKHQIGLILFALPDFSSDIKEGIAEICQGMNVRLVFMKELLKIIDTQLAQPTQYVGASLSKGNYQEGMPIYDPLTGFPNRQLFQDRVMHALAFGRRYRIQHMIVLINLNFPNSALLSLSSNIAYEVIKQAARRIKTCIRESDTLARFGQYEFALILENISEESSTSVVSRIQVILGKPFYVKERIIDLKTYTCIYQTLEDYAKSDRSVEFTRQAVFGSTREYLQ